MKKAMFAAAIGLAFATISLAGSAYNELVTAVNVSLEDNIPQVQAPASNAVNKNLPPAGVNIYRKSGFTSHNRAFGELLRVVNALRGLGVELVDSPDCGVYTNSVYSDHNEVVSDYGYRIDYKGETFEVLSFADSGVSASFDPKAAAEKTGALLSKTGIPVIRNVVESDDILIDYIRFASKPYLETKVGAPDNTAAWLKTTLAELAKEGKPVAYTYMNDQATFAKVVYLETKH